jgi:alpha-beta hydrolase superfamily lysophospholipase
MQRPAMPEAHARTGTFTGADGGQRAWRAWLAATPRAALLVVHGLGEHSGRYHDFAARAAAAGISTFALDLAGHGRSGGRRGHVASFDLHLRDVHTLRAIALAATGTLPLFVLGQSMGGLLTLRYLQEHGAGVRGGVLCSPWLETAAHVNRLKLVLAPLLSRLVPALPFRHGLRPEHLSRDPVAVAAYAADPLVQPYITPRAYTEVRAAVARVEAAPERLAVPLLFLAGDADRVVRTDRTLRLAQGLRGADVTVEVRAGGYHELLHEPDRAEAAATIIAWITART